MQQYYKPVEGLIIKRARIYDRCGVNDDRLQVRVMPDQALIKESKYLPCYPCIFKGQVLNGITEKEDKEKATEVIVACTEDKTYGFVICLANVFHSFDKNEKFSESYGFNYLRQFLNARGLDNIKYSDMVVQNWVFDENQGGYVEMYNYKNGNKYIINSSGTCFVMKQDEIYIRCGSPSEGKSGPKKGIFTKKSPFSEIRITPTMIYMKTAKFEVDAQTKIFGHSGQNICKTFGVSALAVEGANIQGSKKDII
jgi:hypothetical protein